MRRFFILLALPAIMLCSCAAKSTQPETMPKCYTAELEMTDNGREFEAVLTRNDEGWEYEFTAPESIKGLKLSKNTDSFTAELEKLKLTDNLEKLGQNSPARLIAEALDMCASGKGITAEVKDSKTVNKGVVNGADFTVTFDDGLPCSMEIGGEIGVTFKNVRAE